MESGTTRRKRGDKGKGFRTDLLIAWRGLRDRSNTTHKRLVLAIIFVGAVLRVLRLELPVTYEEALTCTAYATGSFGHIFSDYTSPVNHFLHSALVKCSIGIFGVHLWSLRLPALLAGILVMPLFYAFVRAMFNRYIALLALAFIASSGALVEYSALAQGYSLIWMFMVSAMLAGRHFAKRDNPVSAVLVALFCALGMWVAPSMVYPALAIYIWLFFYLVVNYESTLRQRSIRLAGSFGLFILLTALVYIPVVSLHSLDHVMHHPALGENTWSAFSNTHQDRALELWSYFSANATSLVSAIGFMGLTYAAYISVKFRIMLLALIAGAIPLTLVMRAVAAPEVWTYSLFTLHLSSAIALFYLLKLMQERMFKAFTKPLRTTVACLLVLVGFGWMGLVGRADHKERYPQAASAVEWFNGLLKPGDRVYAEYPVEAPFTFSLLVHGMDRSLAEQGPAPGGKVYVLVAPAEGQTTMSVLGSQRVSHVDPLTLVKVKDWKRLEIFAAR